MGDIKKKEQLSFVEDKRNIGLCKAIRKKAAERNRSVNGYLNIVLSDIVDSKAASKIESLLEERRDYLEDENCHGLRREETIVAIGVYKEVLEILKTN